jgi:hypothetical protein
MSFYQQCSQRLLSTKVVDYTFDFYSTLSAVIGCTTSAPDGSSPRGYSQIFSGIGSKYIVFSSASYVILVLIGFASSAPNGISPRVYKEGVH